MQVKIEKEKVYIRASKQVRGWLGAQAKGRGEVGIRAWRTACAKPCGGRESGECGWGVE